jgi:PAS domain S-box-containing protein
MRAPIPTPWAEEQTSTPLIRGLSALAAPSYASADAAAAAIVQLITDQLGMRTSYLTRLLPEGKLEILAAYSAPEGCVLTVGAMYSVPETFCHEVIAGAKPAPVVIENTRTHLHFQNHPAAAAMPEIGSYVGVPMLGADACVFGTLCAIDAEAHTVTQQHVDLLVVLARMLVTHIERDREIAERQRAEHELRVSEERYRTLVEGSPDAIVVLHDGTITFINHAGVTLLGAQRAEELLEHSIINFVHPNSRGLVQMFVMRGDRPHWYGAPREAQVLRIDGQVVPVEVTAIPTTYHGRDALHIIARDISRRKRVEARLAQTLAEQRQINAQLEQLSGAKSHFISIISHEFRTALTGIYGFSETMRDEQLTLGEITEYASDINKEAKRLNRMITEMLDLDRMESGQMSLQLQPVDVNSLITNVVRNAQHTALEHHIIVQLEPWLPSLAADHDKLVQVVAHLLNNAIKYTPHGGAITVTTEQNGDCVSIHVRDQGIGIAPEELDSVFQRFRQAQTDATRYIPGTGLGLPIVQQIIELHGGQVWVESMLGEGSTFHITLPFVRHDPLRRAT